MTMMEVLGSILIALVVIAVAAGNMSTGFSKSKVASTQQDVVTMRMQIQQLFSGSPDYTGLDNATAIKAGVVPKTFVKGNDLKNAWGGQITLSTDATNASFKISLDTVPQDECTQFAKFQPDAWLSVDVNGTAVEGSSDIATIVGACAASNTITYEAR